MMALSIMQPWAGLIVAGVKPVENRSWRTSHRGQLLIHAGLTEDPVAMRQLRKGLHPVTGRLWNPPQFNLQRGGIIGRVRLIDCVSHHESDWFCGPFAFVLEGAEPLPFWPCRNP